MDIRQLQEKRYLLMQEKARRLDGDPLFSWQPHEKQKVFIDAVLDGLCKQAWFVAANRSGKSDAGAYIGSRFARFGNRNARPDGYGSHPVQVTDYATSGWVVSLDYTIGRDIVEPKYFNNGFCPPGGHPPFIPEREISEWRVSDRVLKLKNGSLIGFKSTDSPRTKFQGTEKDWIHFDEEPPEGHYEECMIRVGTRPLITFATCTLLPPEGTVGGVTWVFPKIIQPFQEGELDQDIKVYGASIYDNPYIDPAEIRFLESIYPLGSVQRRIRLDGEWLPGLSGARAYPGFSRALHVRDQLEHYNPNAPLCWYIDFNVEPFISGVGQRDGAMFRALAELAMEECDHAVMAQMLAERFSHHRGPIILYGDATGKNRLRGTHGDSDYKLLQSAIRRHNMNLTLKVPDSNPIVPDRINAVNRLFKDETGEHLCEIDPECKELISDFEQVLRDSHGGIKKSHNPKESYYRRTHASDGWGYWISYEAPVRQTKSKFRSMLDNVTGMAKPTYGFTKRT